MELSELLTGLTYEVLKGTVERKIRKVTNDTENIGERDVFVCIKGYCRDGHDFVGKALERGATALVIQSEECYERWIRCEDFLPDSRNVTIIRVSDTRYALALMSAALYGYPARKMKVIGITGTKGKTTTACMVQQLLNYGGHKTGLIGTVRVDTGRRILSSYNTTPESCQIQAYLHEMVVAGCDSVVMEVSSQGLKLKRTAGIRFEVGIFTNLGRDHIGTSEHADFEEYLQCKHLLFLQSKVGIGNADDPWYEEIFEGIECEKITYGCGGGCVQMDYHALDIRKICRRDCFGIRYRLGMADGKRQAEEIEIELPLPGHFNVYNSMAAAAAVRYLGVENETIREGLKKIRIPGRMELAAAWRDGMVFVDYAHNAMSLKSILQMLREYADGRIVVVFGCGGNRSKERRYEMGEVAGRYADFTVITTDNPRYEEPGEIIKDILTGMKRTNGAYVVVEDRREAVRYAIENRKSGDVIIIAGKGHETYQEIQGIRYEMDDRKLVKEITCTQILS